MGSPHGIGADRLLAINRLQLHAGNNITEAVHVLQKYVEHIANIIKGTNKIMN